MRYGIHRTAVLLSLPPSVKFSVPILIVHSDSAYFFIVFKRSVFHCV